MEELDYSEIDFDGCDNSVTFVEIGKTEYKVEAWFDGEGFSVFRNGEEIDSDEFRKLLLKEQNLGAEITKVSDSYDHYYYVRFVEVRTVPGVQGVYHDLDGNEWYSANLEAM